MAGIRNVLVTCLVLVLGMAGLSGATPAEAGAAQALQQPRETVFVDAPPCFTTVVTRLPDVAGRIIDPRDPERMTMGPDDVVDVDPRGLQLSPGDRLEIYRPLGTVARPEGGVLGEGVLVIGELRIADVADGRVVGRIGQTCSEVQKGDRLRSAADREALESVPKPDFAPDRALIPRSGDATLVFGFVETVPDETGEIGTRWAQMSYGAGEVVTLDQGAADGWEAGAVALVYQHGPLAGDPPSYRDGDVVLLGTGVAISVSRDTTALLLTGGDRAVRVGARARRLQD